MYSAVLLPFDEFEALISISHHQNDICLWFLPAHLAPEGRSLIAILLHTAIIASTLWEQTTDKAIADVATASWLWWRLASTPSVPSAVLSGVIQFETNIKGTSSYTY